MDNNSIDNISYLRKYEKSYTVVCYDKETNDKCIASSIRKDMYNKDNMAVKLYVCRYDNEDGHLDRIVGENEFNNNFNRFELKSL